MLFLYSAFLVMRRLHFATALAFVLACFAGAGRAQDTNTVALFLFTTGSGEINPYLGGQMLNVGQDYEMTAVPDPGFVFGSWQEINVFLFELITLDAQGNPAVITSSVYSPGPIYSDQPVLDFTMQPAVLVFDVPGVRSVTEYDGWQANFTPTPEPSTAGLFLCGLAAVVLLRLIRAKHVRRG